MGFILGQIVHHRRYNYRGVVVGMDMECLAEEDWYSSNRTQPSRNQPWYRVFAEGGHETYVAQENLEADASPAPVDHPYLRRLFPTFIDGRYYTHSLN